MNALTTEVLIGMKVKMEKAGISVFYTLMRALNGVNGFEDVAATVKIKMVVLRNPLAQNMSGIRLIQELT